MKNASGQTFRVSSGASAAVISFAMWGLWIWMLIPAPLSEAARRRLQATSAAPTVHILLVLAVLYGFAVLADERQGRSNRT